MSLVNRVPNLVKSFPGRFLPFLQNHNADDQAHRHANQGDGNEETGFHSTQSRRRWIADVISRRSVELSLRQYGITVDLALLFCTSEFDLVHFDGDNIVII